MPHQEQPFISVVITCYNHGRYLGQAIESVIRQTYVNREVIVVDDGSTDNTAEVARRYDVRYHYKENAGLSAARNTGMELCKGNHVLFLDADDLLMPETLEISIGLLMEHPDWAFVSGNYIWIDCAGQPIDNGIARGIPVEKDHYEALLRSNYIGMHGTVLYRRDLLTGIGGFREDLNAVEDYDVYLRLAKDHPVGCHPGVMAEYRQHGSNMTGDPLRMLSAGIEVLKSIDIPRGNRRLRAARRAGLDFMRRRHGLAFFRKIVAGAKGGRPFRDTMRDAVTLMLLVPPTTFTSFDSALACYRLIRVVPYESYGFRQRA